MLFLCTLVVLSAAVLPGVTPNSMDHPYCPGLTPQNSLDLSSLMERWYAIEIIQHQAQETKNAANTVLGMCPVLTLTRTGPTSIRMIWDEKAGFIEYNFVLQSYDRPGVWIAASPQNGTMLEKPYMQFTGIVQVMKAVGSHMVLTFCSKPDKQLYSLLLCREKTLGYAEVRSVNNMLQRRGLVIGHVREACKNGAATAGDGYRFVLQKEEGSVSEWCNTTELVVTKMDRRTFVLSGDIIILKDIPGPTNVTFEQFEKKDNGYKPVSSMFKNLKLCEAMQSDTYLVPTIQQYCEPKLPCPILAGTYTITNFQPDMSRMPAHFPGGPQWQFVITLKGEEDGQKYCQKIVFAETVST